MLIELTEQLWNLLNPDFKEYMEVTEDDNFFIPEWYPTPDIRISPIMLCVEKDIGREFTKAFMVERKDTPAIICRIDKMEAVELTEKNIFAIINGKKEVIQGENIVNLRNKRNKKGK